MAGSDAATLPFEFGHGGVEVVDLEGDMVDARPAVRGQETGHRAVGASSLQDLHRALAQVEGSIANPHVVDVLLGVEASAEPGFKERLGGVEIRDGQGDAFYSADESHRAGLLIVSPIGFR